MRLRIFSVLTALLLAVPALAAGPAVENSVFEHLQFRSIGPSNMGGRIAEIVGVPGDPNTVFVATAAGGLLKTTTAGVKWTPIFDKQDVLSLGALAVQQDNSDVIWVGTGEGSPRNTVSFGDGVYKTVDGGKTWQHMGLNDSEHITRIAIDPRNPNKVFVCALGHAFGTNTERGVFLTEDGGKTWQKVLYLDDNHAAADLDIDPSNPNLVYATMWHFLRRPWKFESGDEKGGVFKSSDGGHTWHQLTNGLPKLLGRSGVRVAPSNPNVVYVVAESKDGTLFRSDDRGEHFRRMTDRAAVLGRGLYYGHVTVDPLDENRVYSIGMQLSMTEDGGRTWRTVGARNHGDHHTLWVDPKNTRRIIDGDDGGIYMSSDRGATFHFVNNFPLAQFYTVHADLQEPFYHVSGGLQDNGTWTGPSRSHDPVGILNEDWQNVGYGDGFYIVNHDQQPNIFLTDSQGGNLERIDMATAEVMDANPQPRRNDGGPVGELKYRFNWNTPIVVSPHDPNTVYFGGNVLFKSTDFGKTWNVISPDLTTNDPSKTGNAGGGVWDENTTAEYYETIISVAESPARAGNIWVGTDDGLLQVTNDGGKTWNNITKNVKGLPPNFEVSRIDLSAKDANTAFVSFEAHMFDDFHPYIFKTTDGGKTFTNISGNLPDHAYVWVVRQDPKNPNLLYAGTELGLFASFNGGGNWTPLRMGNLPPVAVRDVKIEPRENDLLVATHGRAMQIFDDATVLQEITPDVIASDFHLFGMRNALRVGQHSTHPGMADAEYVGPNPAYGALLTYYFKQKPDAKTQIKLEVLDSHGEVIRSITEFPKEAGLNRTAWDLHVDGPKPRREPTPEERERMQSFFFRPQVGPQVLPGTYTVRLTVNGKSQEQPVTVRLDPTLNVKLADLQEQYDLGIRLRNMMDSTNTAMRSLDSIKAQLVTVSGTVHSLSPDAPKELTTTISDDSKDADNLLLKFARPENIPGYSMGPRLSDSLAMLLYGTQGFDGAPTKPQMDLFQQLQKEYGEQMAAVNNFTNVKLAKLNSLLQQNNIQVAVWGGKPLQPAGAVPAK